MILLVVIRNEEQSFNNTWVNYSPTAFNCELILVLLILSANCQCFLVSYCILAKQVLLSIVVPRCQKLGHFRLPLSMVQVQLFVLQTVTESTIDFHAQFASYSGQSKNIIICFVQYSYCHKSQRLFLPPPLNRVVQYNCLSYLDC